MNNVHEWVLSILLIQVPCMYWTKKNIQYTIWMVKIPMWVLFFFESDWSSDCWRVPSPSHWEPSGKQTQLLKMANYSGFTHWKWWFSIVMLVYQRVPSKDSKCDVWPNHQGCASLLRSFLMCFLWRKRPRACLEKIGYPMVPLSS